MTTSVFLQGLIAGLAGTVASTVVYSPAVLGRAWMRATGITEQEFRDRARSQSAWKTALPMLMATLSTIAAAIAIAWAADTLQASPRQALMLSFGAACVAIHALLLLRFFERRPWSLVAINAVAHVATLGAVGAVLGSLR